MLDIYGFRQYITFFPLAGKISVQDRKVYL